MTASHFGQFVVREKSDFFNFLLNTFTGGLLLVRDVKIDADIYVHDP